MITLQLGTEIRLGGTVTTLNWIAARPPRAVEASLGYGMGRLSAGYKILLLKENLHPGDFEFGGTTLRSDGRSGLPQSDPAMDKARPRVHQAILNERGGNGYVQLQKHALSSAAIVGPQRIAKVVPVTPHQTAMPPDKQYPMGGGGLQWKLVKEKRFLVALEVMPDGTARAPSFTVSLDEKRPALELLDARTKVARYLAAA